MSAKYSVARKVIRMNNKCYGNNKGFSLVELIVIVLIMGVLVTGAAISFSVVYNADEERAAKKIVSMMGEARTKAIALNSDTADVTFEIRKDANGNFVAGIYKTVSGTKEELVPAERISNYRVKIELAMKNKTNRLELKRQNEESTTEEVYATYSFKKSTGGLKNVSGKTNNASFSTVISGGEDNMYLDIIVSKGSDEQHLIIVPATGRCYLE